MIKCHSLSLLLFLKKKQKSLHKNSKEHYLVLCIRRSQNTLFSSLTEKKYVINFGNSKKKLMVN